MAQPGTSNPPVSIKVFRVFAPKVRELAQAMGITHTELDVPGGTDLVKFTFDLDFADAQPFLSRLPIEVFASHGVVESHA